MKIKKYLLCAFLKGIAFLSISSIVISEEEYSPYINQSYPMNVYWGDTHVHTNLSHDGFISATYGATPSDRLTPDDAYLFAKGKAVIATNGIPFRLSRPLDFLVITDHGEAMGLMYGLATKNSLLLKSAQGREWAKKIEEINKNNTPKDAEALAWGLQSKIIDYFQDRKNTDVQIFRSLVWNDVINNAERHNNPGKFTAFIGYEWSGMVYGGEGRGWWHRNVIFKDGAEKVSKVLPFTQVDSSKPEDLWLYLSDYERNTAGEVLAIPHNPNLSGGHMFKLKDSQGQLFSNEYALTRSLYEPLIEVTQTKGDSETHPLLSPNDEFADFDTWMWFGGPNSNEKNRRYDYVRSALKLGLQEHARIGTNPFKFGLIGSTDSHTTLSNIEESNFGGKLLDLEPNKDRLIKAENWFENYLGLKNTFSAAGFAAVWAQENTRESLFAAMRRKEVYASTGPRIEIRFFGGWGYKPDDAYRPDFVQIGYNKGVPMGGDLTHAPKDRSPTFLIRAVKDPDGANLDRVQVIKGWHDKNGELQEKIYDVALSDNRKKSWSGKVKPVGNTVDVKDASYINSIGDPELAIVWKDPDFERNERAFYYVRVLEIPTPRWTAYDVKFFKIMDVPKNIKMIAQERAYTSPIWYTPKEI